jgi:hypothetical protein
MLTPAQEPFLPHLPAGRLALATGGQARRTGHFAVQDHPVAANAAFHAAVVAALAFAFLAGAITYGAPDGNGHPEVGALLAPHHTLTAPGRPARGR